MNLRGYGAASWRCSDSQAAGISINRRDLQLPSDLVVQLQRCDGFLAHLTVRHDYEVEIDETE
jgi:hypothetical protein